MTVTRFNSRTDSTLIYRVVRVNAAVRVEGEKKNFNEKHRVVSLLNQVSTRRVLPCVKYVTTRELKSQNNRELLSY